jgi:hypothetical protein
MIDIATQLHAIDRQVIRRPGSDGEEVSVLIRRNYDAAIADVWDALTDPDRMKRWFLPITGNLREEAPSNSKATLVAIFSAASDRALSG